MKDFSTSFFVLRTPLFPLSDFLALSQQLETPGTFAADRDPEQAIENDRRLIRRRLLEFTARPEVKEALWVASPEFFESLAIWRRDPESEKGRRLEQALYRYVARMTSRPTPFGVFAGCSLGRIGTETRLQIGPRKDYWRRSRLDMEYLCNLAEKIVADPLLRAHLSFRPNTSLYLAAGRYHHVQGYFIDNVRAYRLIATDFTSYLAVTLERAAAGATPEELASALVADDPDIALDEAQAYIGQLIESQILVSDVVPPITGPEPIDDMIAQLNKPETLPLARTLSAISDFLHKLDEGRLGNDLAEYQKVVSAVSELPATYKLEHLIQVDMMKPADNACLDQRLIQEIVRGIEVLHSMHRAPQHDVFTQFKQDFRDRYQDQEVPLVLALDDEIGIGFEKKDSPSAMAEPLLEELELGRADNGSEIKARKSEILLLRKVEELARQKKNVLELDPELLKSLRTETPLPLPAAFSVMGTLDAGASRPRFHLHSVGGPSGAILLGRFCHADPQLADCVKEHLRAEEEAKSNGHAVFAEVAHLPEGRIGNVLFRPVLREYEIPYMATSRVASEHQIAVTDLVISVENDRVVLRSRRLGREVLPRLTSAHGYFHGRSLKLYKFLCSLQSQGVAGGNAWNWGLLDELSFLPRVTLGNLIFSLARWRIEKKTIEEMAKQNAVERIRGVHSWRSEHAVPRFVMLTEADNQLLIDFENVLSIETFLDYGRKREYVHLVEMLPDPDSLAAEGPEGKFTHELVIPFTRAGGAARQETTGKERSAALLQGEQHPAAALVSNGQRNFLPGSEWLFAKIYGSPSHLDRFLVETVRPLAADILAAGDADGWFFIRYGDPHWHLRLRFHGDPLRLSSRVIPRLFESVRGHANDGKVWRVQFDTYEREIERYGGIEGTLIAERLFQFDSELVLELLASISDRLGSNLRWRLAFASVDRLLCALGSDMARRRNLVNSMGKNFEKTFAANERYRKQLAEKFRKERGTLEKLLENPLEINDVPATISPLLQQYARRVRDVREELESLQQTGKLTKSIDELASSYVHMHLNRMLRSTANAQEMVLYDFLVRTWDSRAAREKHQLQVG